MTEIPFLANLGDALDAAIATRAAPRRSKLPRRRFAVIAVAVVAVLALAAIAVARIVSSSDELATGIACYQQADLSADVTIVESHGSPVRACAEALRRAGATVRPLVACAQAHTVAVIPGRREGACLRAGLRPLPYDYHAASAKTARLQSAVLALEARHDCIAPARLAGEVQRLLDQAGWTGWRAHVVPNPQRGPCGAVSAFDGAGHRTIGGALDPERRLLLVTGGASRSTMVLLYGPRGIARSLEDESGTRCLSVAQLRSLVEQRAGAGRTVTVLLDALTWNVTGVTVADARWARFRAGCAVLAEVRAAPDGQNLVAVVPRLK